MSNTANNNVSNTITGSLGEWECNGYHDSDWYAVYWDGKEVRTKLIDTTRGVMARPQLIRATDAELLAARDYGANLLVQRLTADAEHRILKPDSANKGDTLRLTEKVVFEDKRSGETVTAEAGEAGTVIWVGNWGTFYRNGYNRRGRHNCRVGLKMDNGRVVFCAMEKCRLDEEIPTPEEIFAQAEDLSWSGFWADYSNAWMTWNWAAERLPELRKANPEA